MTEANKSDQPLGLASTAKLGLPPERESVGDALMIVESYGPWGADLNDAHRRQIVLADEVKRRNDLQQAVLDDGTQLRRHDDPVRVEVVNVPLATTTTEPQPPRALGLGPGHEGRIEPHRGEPPAMFPAPPRA